MSSEDISFQLGEDGELVCKHADRRGLVEAMRRAIAKNEDRPEAFLEPDSDQDDEENEAETPAERRARLRRELAEADGRERRRNAVPKQKAWSMDDLTAVADTICKSADPKTVVTKLAAAEVNAGASLFTSYERSVMLTAVASRSIAAADPTIGCFRSFCRTRAIFYSGNGRCSNRTSARSPSAIHYSTTRSPRPEPLAMALLESGRSAAVRLLRSAPHRKVRSRMRRAE